MAFTLYAGDIREVIGHDEEYLLNIVAQSEEKYPILFRLSCEFYDSPVFDDEQAGAIVHELIDVLTEHGRSDANLSRTIVRLLPFFSTAFRKPLTIRSRSD